MSSAVLFLLAAVGFIIAVIICIKGKKVVLGLVVGIMSAFLVFAGLNGYNEIKKDAAAYHPLAVQWLEDKDENSMGGVQKTQEIKALLTDYSIYCIYYSRDNTKAVVYVELPASPDNLVMAFNRSNKSLNEVSFIDKKMKPEANFQNKLDPGIFFY